MADPLDDIADDIHGRANMAGVRYAVGKLEAERLSEYPRVVWVSPGGTIGPQHDVGSRVQTNNTDRKTLIRTDEMRVELHIWGSDREQCRDIMRAQVSTMWERLQGNVAFGDYTWVTEQGERGEHATHGSKLILEAAILGPIHEGEVALTADLADSLTSLTGQAHTGKYEDNATGVITTQCDTT